MSKNKKMESPSPIILTYEEERYELEFTKKSIETAENQKFKLSEALDFPMTGLPKLLYYSFLANHSGIKRRVVDAIFDNLGGNKAEFFERLVELYNYPVTALIGDNEESEKNAMWE